MIFQPAVDPARKVALCARCHSARPSREAKRLGPADLAWRVLERDVTSLLTAYEDGRWIAQTGELEFAAGLARMPWTEESMRAAVDDTDDYVYAGKLVRALEGNAYSVLRHVAAGLDRRHTDDDEDSLAVLVEVLGIPGDCVRDLTWCPHPAVRFMLPPAPDDGPGASRWTRFLRKRSRPGAGSAVP
ncbi:hypothetical protein [Streptomyces amritsarensis]|uniref:hypothetical protein n=1 Tax=Streptomyces amritsarensis TaxID=681158 RepID=UPI0036BD3786